MWSVAQSRSNRCDNKSCLWMHKKAWITWFKNVGDFQILSSHKGWGDALKSSKNERWSTLERVFAMCFLCHFKEIFVFLFYRGNKRVKSDKRKWLASPYTRTMERERCVWGFNFIDSEAFSRPMRIRDLCANLGALFGVSTTIYDFPRLRTIFHEFLREQNSQECSSVVSCCIKS